ncbi:MAG: hypothetical protein JST33_03835 [Actinobacteria bacterium]|nr:hypothetical protein [Actinomycetota bacterium]
MFAEGVCEAGSVDDELSPLCVGNVPPADVGGLGKDDTDNATPDESDRSQVVFQYTLARAIRNRLMKMAVTPH